MCPRRASEAGSGGADPRWRLLLASVRDTLPATVQVELAPIGRVATHLFAEEEKLIERAVSSRRAEFAAGRTLLRRALAALGAPELPILRDRDGAPLLPSGFVGSISHSRSLCVAAAASRWRIGAIGIDVELDAPEQLAGAEELVFDEAERSRLTEIRQRHGVDLTVAAFGAKESAYKFLYSVRGPSPDPRPITVEWIDDEHFTVFAGSSGDRRRVDAATCIVRAQGHVFTAVWAEPPPK
jgi:4'-phosphopantetheinyl transferase EntD